MSRHRPIEDEAAVRRVKADPNLLVRIGATDTVSLALAADADLATLVRYARPGEGGQESIYASKVKERQFPVCTEETSWLKELWMGFRRRATGTTFRSVSETSW